MTEYDGHADSIASFEHSIAAQRLHYIINRAADDFGRPLPAGLAMFISTKLVTEIPTILDAVASASKGTVK